MTNLLRFGKDTIPLFPGLRVLPYGAGQDADAGQQQRQGGHPDPGEHRQAEQLQGPLQGPGLDHRTGGSCQCCLLLSLRGLGPVSVGAMTPDEARTGS